MVLSNLIFYIFSASCILVYGVGIKDLLLTVENPKNVFLYSVKTLLSTICTVILTWVISTYVLGPKSLSDIFPFFLVFFALAFSILLSFLFKLLLKKEISEFVLTFFIAFLAVNESTTLLHGIIIAIVATIGFYALIPIFYAIKYRINISLVNIELKKAILILVSIGIILILLFAYNISWFNFGVI